MVRACVCISPSLPSLLPLTLEAVHPTRHTEEVHSQHARPDNYRGIGESLIYSGFASSIDHNRWSTPNNPISRSGE